MMHFINVNNKAIVLQQSYSLEKSPVLTKAGGGGRKEKISQIKHIPGSSTEVKTNIRLKMKNFWAAKGKNSVEEYKSVNPELNLFPPLPHH